MTFSPLVRRHYLQPNYRIYILHKFYHMTFHCLYISRPQNYITLYRSYTGRKQQAGLKNYAPPATRINGKVYVYGNYSGSVRYTHFTAKSIFSLPIHGLLLYAIGTAYDSLANRKSKFN
jgi:hypothetical protein